MNGLITDERSSDEPVLESVECGARSTSSAHGWRGYRVDVEEGDEPTLAFYCPDCAECEFGHEPRRAA